jgi:hypothetical protein
MGASRKGTAMPYYTGNFGLKTPRIAAKEQRHTIKKRKPQSKDWQKKGKYVKIETTV